MKDMCERSTTVKEDGISGEELSALTMVWKYLSYNYVKCFVDFLVALVNSSTVLKMFVERNIRASA